MEIGYHEYLAINGSRYRVPLAAINPCIATYGQGPAAARCGSCAHLGATRAGAQTLYYCRYSGQPKRVTWPACANFAEPSSSQPSAVSP